MINLPDPMNVVGGVYSSDPSHPPTAPNGAVASAIVDTGGRVIGWYWVIPELEIAAETEAWAFFDRHGATPPPAFARPRLMR